MVDMELKLLVQLCGKIPETYALYKILKFEHFVVHTTQQTCMSSLYHYESNAPD